MNPILKIVFYLVLVGSAIVFGQRFFAAYSEKMERAATRLDQAEGTNAPAVATLGGAVISRQRQSSMGFYAFGTLAVVLVGAILFGHDVSMHLAQRAHKVVFEGEAQDLGNPEYEEAEQVWANGDFLEAVRLLRDYLKKNPREQHVALRIAEIYEKDLRNPLAAALEYEEILTKKLAPERWGWAAIHLCNLYYRLEKPDKALALLRRIDERYPDTSAAEKARKRLAMIEAGEEPLSDQTGAPGSTPPA